MTFSYPTAVTLVEVGPRDGLQNEKSPVTTEQKVRLIEMLAQTGLRRIEAGSFVSPKWVPQMADSAAVFSHLYRTASDFEQAVTYSALTPNLKGLEAALDAGVTEVAVFGSASESFSKKNINCSIEDSLRRFEPVMALAAKENVKVRGYVSCVLGCPYEGEIAPASVARVSRQLSEMGCFEISLGDTIGTGTPVKTADMLDAVSGQLPVSQLAVHFHDTYGQALVNIHTALLMGISIIDSAVAGLGGCPYAKGASGNVATEDVLYMLNGMGIHTNVEMPLLLKACRFISEVLGRQSHSKVAHALSI